LHFPSAFKETKEKFKAWSLQESNRKMLPPILPPPSLDHPPCPYSVFSSRNFSLVTPLLPPHLFPLSTSSNFSLLLPFPACPQGFGEVPVRVHLPGRLVLQAAFHAAETVGTLQVSWKLVRSTVWPNLLYSTSNLPLNGCIVYLGQRGFLPCFLSFLE
jgi:hypothetical protein